jgi:uncharacterized lipoprotein YajG
MRLRWLWTLALLLLFASALSSGCAPQQVILVPPGEPVQLAEPVKASVFVFIDGRKQPTPVRVEIPAGWFCLPDPGED